MSKICFAEDGWSDYLYWQNNDKKLLKKINVYCKALNAMAPWQEKVNRKN